MTQQDINIFLAIVEKRNLSKAASSLFMSQSTLSHRLSVLEKELNAPLFTRRKGQRTLDLTPFGHDFISIAERWTALWTEIQDLHTIHESRSFYIGSVASLVENLFHELLHHIFLEEKDQIRLMIKTMPSAALYPALENREIDLGFSVQPSLYNNVINTPLLNEENVLLLGKGESSDGKLWGEDIHPSELDPCKELLFQFSHNYIHWRNQWFGYFSNPSVGIADSHLLQHFFSSPNDNWSVVPFSTALAIGHSCNVSIHHIITPPPPRTCYMLTHRIPRAGYESCLQVFQSHLHRFLKDEEAAGHLQILL